ncbi:hypothetical protein ACA910_012398 [Epithemia clementina (nom. ined.)]
MEHLIRGLYNKVSDPQPCTTTSLRMAYLGDGKEAYDGSYNLDPSVVPEEEAAAFVPFKNPQQFWPLTLLEEPSLMVGRLLVVTAAAIYGTNFASVKMLNDIMPTGVSAVARFGLAAVVVTAMVFQAEGNDAAPSVDLKEERKQATVMGLEIGGWYSIGYMAQAVGLMTVDASKSAFFNALAVVVVPLLDALFKRKKINKTMMGAIALAIGGVGMLQLGPSSAAAVVSSSASSHGGFGIISTGDILSFVQALMFGVGYWRLESAAGKFSNQAARITVGQLVGVALGAIVYCIFSGQVPDLSSVAAWASNPFVLKAVAWTGLISTALALFIETVALKVVSATELTVLMTSVSVWGSAFAFVTMGEILPPIGMVGGALILSSCILSATSSSSSSPPPLDTLPEEKDNLALAAVAAAASSESSVLVPTGVGAIASVVSAGAPDYAVAASPEQLDFLKMD